VHATTYCWALACLPLSHCLLITTWNLLPCTALHTPYFPPCILYFSLSAPSRTSHDMPSSAEHKRHAVVPQHIAALFCLPSSQLLPHPLGAHLPSRYDTRRIHLALANMLALRLLAISRFHIYSISFRRTRACCHARAHSAGIYLAYLTFCGHCCCTEHLVPTSTSRCWRTRRSLFRMVLRMGSYTAFQHSFPFCLAC